MVNNTPGNRNQHSDDMLKEKTYQDYNKLKPDPNDPNQNKKNKVNYDEKTENKIGKVNKNIKTDGTDVGNDDDGKANPKHKNKLTKNKVPKYVEIREEDDDNVNTYISSHRYRENEKREQKYDSMRGQIRNQKQDFRNER